MTEAQNPHPRVKRNSPEIAEFAKSIQQLRERARRVINKAEPALRRLIKVMSQRSNQSYHLRRLLFSLWNGKPASLLDIVDLDLKVRENLMRVVIAFGVHDGTREFFYDSISTALKAAGQMEWFLAEAEEKK